MKKLFFTPILVLALGFAVARPAHAGELKLSIANGRVTLIAQEVPLRQILSEWARLGQTRFVNADKLTGPPLTLQLVDVPEKQALDIVLHSASGYVAAPRPAGTAGASMYDRVMILATSRPPAVSASAVPPPFARPQVPMPRQQPADDDDGEPEDQGPVPPPGVVPPGVAQPGMMNVPGQPPQPYPGMMQPPPNVQLPPGQVPLTAPRPGMLPTPAPGTPGNPYQPYPPQPQVRKPGGGQ